MSYNETLEMTSMIFLVFLGFPMSFKTPGPFEEMVMRAVQRLQPNAYGITIMALLEEATGGDVALGAVYTTLERLEKKGYVKSWRSDPTPERGGRAKRMFELQAPGAQALSEAERKRSRLNLATLGRMG